MFGVALALLMAAGPDAAGSATALPYQDGFEYPKYSLGPLPTTGAWSTNGGGSVTVTNSPTPASGNQECKVSDLQVTLSIDQSKGVYTNTWWQFWTRPTLYDDDGGNSPPTNFSAVAGVFYVTTGGAVRAYGYNSGGGTNEWTSLTSAGYVSTNGWIGFQVHMMYASSNWDLWITTTTNWANATKLNSSPLVFASGSANTELGAVEYHNDVLIDDVYVYAASLGRGVGLPFADGFETYSLGALPTNQGIWRLTGSQAAATVVSTPVAEPSQACAITNANLILDIDQTQGNYSNIWCQVYVKPTAYDDKNGPPSVAADASAAWYISTNGYLRAYVNMGSSNAWTNVVSVSLSGWLGIVTHVDYVQHQWDIYCTTAGYGTVMTRANATPLLVQTDATNLTAISDVTVQNSANVDAVAVSLSSLAATGSTKLVTLSLLGGRTNLWGVLAHHYSANDNTLAGTFGADLKSGLTDGDKVRFFYTNEWNQYTLNDGVWVKLWNDIGMAVSNLHITSGMGMWVERSRPTNAVAFFPFNTIPSVTNMIYGTNTLDAENDGWNLLGWPFTATQTAGSGWGFLNGRAGWGDRMYIYNNGSYVRLWWNGDVGTYGTWYNASQASGYTMQPGQGFWYYRAGTTVQWVVANPSP